MQIILLQSFYISCFKGTGEVVYETFHHKCGREFQCMYVHGKRFYLDEWASKEVRKKINKTLRETIDFNIYVRTVVLSHFLWFISYYLFSFFDFSIRCCFLQFLILIMNRKKKKHLEAQGIKIFCISEKKTKPVREIACTTTLKH